MIPNELLFNRFPRRTSGRASAAYYPRALITKFTGQDHDPIEKFDATEMVEGHTTIVHETTHWIQHHSTSFGCFLSALQLSQEMTAMSWLRSCDDTVAQRLVDRRFRQGLPLLELQETGQPHFSEGTPFNDPTAVAKQLWFDHQWVYAFFDNVSQTKSVGPPPLQALSDVIGDVILYLSQSAGLGVYPGHSVARNRVKANVSYKLVRLDQYDLTSNLLMECAALIDEIEVLDHGFWQQWLRKTGTKPYRTRIEALIKDHYGIPFRIFVRESEPIGDNVDDWLTTVRALCFLALDPPLPPLYPWTSLAAAWSWEDLYPPTRYVRLCAAAKKVGLLSRDHAGPAIVEYFHRLADVSLVPWCGTGENPLQSRRRNWDFGARTFVEADGKMLTYHDYVFWVQQQFWAMRNEDIQFLTSYGSCLSGRQSQRHFLLLMGGSTVPFASCPLIWGGNHTLRSAHNTAFGEWLALSVAIHYSMFDIMIGRGPIDLSVFPPDVANEPRVHQAIEEGIWVNSRKQFRTAPGLTGDQ